MSNPVMCLLFYRETDIILKMPAVRKLAIIALNEIFKGGKPKDTLESLSEKLNARDRAFLMELVYGVLRHRDTLDWISKGFLKKPQRLTRETVNNLRLGAYQILYTRVPEWAAVNETVKLEKKAPGVLNAVLRNIIRKREQLTSELNNMREAALNPSTPNMTRTSHIATVTSHPRWLIKRWIKRFGYKEAFELAEANNKIPPLTLRVNTLKTNRDEVIKRLKALDIDCEPTTISPDGIKLKGTHAFRDFSDLKGYIFVQDEAAQLITYMLDPQPGEKVLDACAAPGGKTTHIAQLMGDSGEIIAVEYDEKRIARLEENISALGLSSIRIIKADITDLKNTEIMKLCPFDRIMLDAPCSSTGVIRRNPDIKYRRRAEDLLVFRKKQLDMLRSVSALLKPGGILVYSTCSTEPDEGEEVIRGFLKTSRDFYIIKDVPFAEGLCVDGFLRTYPHKHDMDGFFGVRLYKNP
jgi:16S rRNA (cytosine967-C5)-methyltransferase